MFTHDIRRKKLLAILKEARLQAGLRQVDVADLLRKPQSFVAKVESGERKIDFIETIDICHAIGIDPVSLLNTLA